MIWKNYALRAEWRNIQKHRIILISLVVMLFIPIMYGGFFLGSIWDPYGNTKHLPVAVVNEDEGTELNGKALHAGADLVNNLRNNDSMGWQFVSAAEGKRGIESGKYYMRLVIPKEFSRNVATVTSAHPTKSELIYTVTPARNYVASLITSQAAKQVQRNVSNTITAAYVSTILENITTLGDGLNRAAAGAAEIASGNQKLSSGVTGYTSGVTRLVAGETSLTQGLSNLTAGSSALKNGLTTLHDDLPSETQVTQLTDGVKSLQSGIHQLNTAVHTPDPALVAQQEKVANEAYALGHTTLPAYQEAVTNAGADIATLQTAVTAGQTDATVNAGNILAVLSSSGTVVSQATTLLADVNTFATMLNAQQVSLAVNTSTLDTGVSKLSSNLLPALDGYITILHGTNSLIDGAGQLYTGSTAALTGSKQILGGAQKLDSSSLALISGVADAADGSRDLSAAADTIANQIAMQPTTEATKNQIVTPVAITEERQGDVPNYGFALSPYVLSLGLFVGALAFNVIYPVRRFFDKPKNALSWWGAKMSVAFAVAIGQAFVLDAIMVFGLGLRPDNPGQFVLMSVVTSITYMSIISLLALALDNVGRFVAMVLLVLQLGSAGGVFPVVLSNRFFQAVNPFVPMTYSIYGYREAISSGMGTHIYWSSLGILFGVAFAANAGIVIFLKRHGMHHFHHESVDDSN